MRFVDDPLEILTSGRAKLWMLVVGVNQYQDERLTPLNFAVSDCQGLAEALKEATKKFPNAEVISHYSSTVQTSTLEAIRASLGRIEYEAKSQDTVLFYFSGHGMIEPASKQPFLCLTETQIDDLNNTGLGLQGLLLQLQLCGASKQLVILDACHSGSIVPLWGGARGEVESQPNPTRELAEVLQQCAAQSRGFCALLSCEEGQQSWEFPDLKHGVFTYYLMQGLRGEAADAKGIIEVSYLYKYVYDQTQQYVDSRMRQLHLTELHNYQQTPRLIMSVSGNLVLGLKPEANDLLQDYEKRLLEYRRKFNMAIQREYPLDQNTRQQLQQLQQETGLRNEDISSVEERIIAVYEQKLDRYKQEINASIYQQYPFSNDTRQQLQQSQKKLGLSNEIATSIEQHVTVVYEQNLQQYEETFTRVIQRQYPLSADDREFLEHRRRLLNLSEEITQYIEAQATQAYEQELHQYEEAFTGTFQGQYPFNQGTRQQLQQSSELRKEVTDSIEARVTAVHKQKLQQDEPAMTANIDRQYPLITETQETPGSATHVSTPLHTVISKSKWKNNFFSRKSLLLIAGGIVLSATGIYYSQQLSKSLIVEEVPVVKAPELSPTKTLSGHLDSVWSVVVSSNKQTLVSGSEDKTIKVWNPNGELPRTLSGHSDTVRSLALSSDGQTLASGSADKTIKLWNLQTGEQIRTLSGHSGPVWSIAISRDGQSLISGGGDNSIKIWHLQSGELRRTLYEDSEQIFSVAISPDGQTFATSGIGKTVKIWNLQTGELLRTLKGHSDSVRFIAISPNGQKLASGSWDKTIKVWDLQTGKKIHTLEGHTAQVVSVAFSSDGQTLASASLDKTIKIWELQKGKLLGSLSGHSDWVLTVAISPILGEQGPTGQTIVSGSKDKKIKIWHFNRRF